MWLQATITLDDLTHYLNELLPLKIQLDDGDDSQGGGRVLDLAAPEHVRMVPSVGVEIETSARIVWPVLGIHVPAVVRTVRAIFKPSVTAIEGGDSSLGFDLHIEHLDLTLVPGIVEGAIKDVLNADLARPGRLPSWNFTRQMDFRFGVPRQLGFEGEFRLAASWAELKITEDGFTLAMSFIAGVDRGRAPHEAAEASPVGDENADSEPEPRIRAIGRGESEPIADNTLPR